MLKAEERGRSLISCGAVILEENRNLSYIFAYVPEVSTLILFCLSISSKPIVFFLQVDLFVVQLKMLTRFMIHFSGCIEERHWWMEEGGRSFWK